MPGLPCCRGCTKSSCVHSAIGGCHLPSDCVSSLEVELGEPPHNNKSSACGTPRAHGWGRTGAHARRGAPPLLSPFPFPLSLPGGDFLWFRVTIARTPYCRGLNMYKKKFRVNVHSAIGGCHLPFDCVSSLEAELGEPPRNWIPLCASGLGAPRDMGVCWLLHLPTEQDVECVRFAFICPLNGLCVHHSCACW